MYMNKCLSLEPQPDTAPDQNAMTFINQTPENYKNHLNATRLEGFKLDLFIWNQDFDRFNQKFCITTKNKKEANLKMFKS